MARTTKIACDEVIYTVREDAYGSTVEADVPDIDEDETHAEGEAAMEAERARYAGILRELDEYEQAVAAAEVQADDAEYCEQQTDREDDEDITKSLY